MKQKTKENNKIRGIMFFLILFGIGSFFFIYDLMNLNIVLYNYINPLIFMIIFIPSIILISFIHELNHWLSAKTFGYKNNQIGISPIMFFVNIEKRLDKDKAASIIVSLAGPLLTIAEISILTALVFKIFPLIYIVFITGVFLNIFNALPVFQGLDGYEALLIAIKSNKNKKQLAKLRQKLSVLFSTIFVSIFLSFIIYELAFIYFNIWLLISAILTVLLVIFFNTKKGKNMFNNLNKLLNKKQNKNILSYKHFMIIFNLKR
ncbi:MAG: hypothetical protein QXF15_03645 [Candidatus Aenigmatarchaeota archaeon]